MFKRSILSVFVILFSQSALAQNTTSNMKATASISPSCQFTSSDVMFGDYNPNDSSPLTTTQTNTILCTKGTAYKFYTLSQYNGTWNYASFRGQWVASMFYNGTPLYYQVKMPTGSWQDDLLDGNSPNDGHYVATGTGKSEVYSLQYRVLENQYVPPGNYSGFATSFIEF